MRNLLLAACCFLLFGSVAYATPFPIVSTDVGVCDPDAPTHCIKPDSSGNVPITGSITASLGGFLPSLSYGTLTATAASSASTALPTNTGTVAFQNQTTVAVSCTLAAGAATALTNEIIVPAGSTIFVATTGYDHAACINQTGSASNVIVMAGGSGLGTGFGGGGSGGGGGAITMASGAVASGAYAAGALAAGALAAGAGADGWDLTQGAKADAACGTASGNCSVTALLKYLNTVAGTAVPVTVNGTATGLTGLTPGVAQTGTIVAANMDLSSVAGTALGAMANYGTSPGAVKVQGVNAFITNSPTVALNTTPTLANGNGTVPTQGGAVLSATNGMFTNVLQGNAVLSATNGLFSNQLQGNAVLSATNPTFTRLTDGTTAQVTDPCQGATKTILPITLATAAVKVIATGVSAKKIYVCAIDLTNNAADSVAVFEATTGTTCATAAVAVVGAGTSVATAATGYNFAANGGISKGQGGYSVWQTTVNNNDLCIAQSAATQLSGTIAYVVQ